MKHDARLFLDGRITRRAFVSRVARTGVAAGAAVGLARSLAAEPQGRSDGAGTGRVLSGLTGGEVMAECLIDWKVRYVFGLGGSEEVGFLDALVDRLPLQYVHGLHESSVVAMADGYARASGEPSFVNVHSVAGTAYALGQIVNAFKDRIPIVITAGDQASSIRGQHAFLEAIDLAQLPRDYTKWHWDVLGADTIPEVMRRAFLLAQVPPAGPAFISFSKDFWERRVERAEILPRDRSQPDLHAHPDPDAVSRAADLLIGARFPLIVAGGEIGQFGGADEIREIAELLGAPVFSDLFATHTAVTFPTADPQYVGFFAEDDSYPKDFDVFWSAGGRMFNVGAPVAAPLVPRTAKTIHTSLDTTEVGRNYPVDVAMAANVKMSAAAVLRELHRRSPRSTAIDERRTAVLRYSRDRRRRLDEAAQQVWGATPISVERLAVELNRRLDPGAVLVCEIISEEQVADAYFDLNQGAAGRRQFITSGGCLGWGVPAAIGAKIAQPDRQVVALVGDGSFQFGVQALWTAARYEVPILVVIFDNNAYQANRKYLQQYGGRAAKTGRYIGSWLGSPEIDHPSIAKAYGVDAEKVSDPNQVGPALDRAARATSNGQPYVLDVKIRPRFDSTWHDFFSVARRLPRQT